MNKIIKKKYKYIMYKYKIINRIILTTVLIMIIIIILILKLDLSKWKVFISIMGLIIILDIFIDFIYDKGKKYKLDKIDEICKKLEQKEDLNE